MQINKAIRGVIGVSLIVGLGIFIGQNVTLGIGNNGTDQIKHLEQVSELHTTITLQSNKNFNELVVINKKMDARLNEIEKIPPGIHLHINNSTINMDAHLMEVDQAVPPPVIQHLVKKVIINMNDVRFIDGIKHWEGFRSKKYICAGGKETIGYGFTGREIRGRSHITKAAAHEQLVNDVLPEHFKNVEELVKVPLTNRQKMALVSFSYNLGRTNLYRLVSGPNRLNSGNYKSIEKILPQYRKASGKVRKGLEYRRSWELAVWNGDLDAEYVNN